MTKVTYGQLEAVLRSLGFSLRKVVEKNKVYLHRETGALVVFPEFPPEEAVFPHHLLAVRSILHAYGIADPMDFTMQLQRAG